MRPSDELADAPADSSAVAFPLGPRAVVVALVVLGQLGLAALAQLVGRSYAPALVFPVVVGLVVGWATVAGLSRAGINSRKALVACALCFAVVNVTLQHVISYLAYRQARELALERNPLGVGLADDEPGAVEGFGQFMSAAERRGRDWIGGVWVGWGAWFTWGVDLVLAMGAAGAWAWRRSNIAAAFR